MGLKGEYLREQVTAELCWTTATLVAREGRHSLWCKPHPGTDLRHGQPVEHAPLTPTNTGFIPRSLSQDSLRGSAPCWENEATARPAAKSKGPEKAKPTASRKPQAAQAGSPSLPFSHRFMPLTLAVPLRGAWSDLLEALRTCHLPPASASDQF